MVLRQTTSSRRSPDFSELCSWRGCASLGSMLDRMGPLRAACPRSGRLKTRALPTERTLARVCREAGATVRRDVKLRDMNTSVRARDERAIEVLAICLPIQQGAQLAVDITLRSALTVTGEPRSNGATTNGAALQSARHVEEAKYPELLEGDRCRLVVIGVETGGRFSQEAVEFVHALAAAKASDSPPVMRRSAHLAWRRGGCGCWPSHAAVRSLHRWSRARGEEGEGGEGGQSFAKKTKNGDKNKNETGVRTKRVSSVCSFFGPGSEGPNPVVRTVGGQNLVFPLHNFHSFFLSWWSSRGILVAGVSHGSPRAQTCISGSRRFKPLKFHEKDPQERKKE